MRTDELANLPQIKLPAEYAALIRSAKPFTAKEAQQNPRKKTAKHENTSHKRAERKNKRNLSKIAQEVFRQKILF